MKVYTVTEKQWVEYLSDFLLDSQVYAPIKKEKSIDFEELTPRKLDFVYYDGNTPITPLKAFLFPVKENVVNLKKPQSRIIIGVPNCDLAALNLLDNIYLGEEFRDPTYKENRENTIIFGKDCYQYKDSCHCTAYHLKPYPEKNCDVSMSLSDGLFYLTPMSKKGEELLEKYRITKNEGSEELPEKILQKRNGMMESLQELNKDLPDEIASRRGIEIENVELWKKHASTCVSCGACSFICPTCHCFLLIDKENFEKVKNWDVCQFPSFAKVAAGEDPLKKLYDRLKYRYLCKFIYKPDMFKAIACTGCGRCTDTCIGKINKNEVIKEACK